MLLGLLIGGLIAGCGSGDGDEAETVAVPPPAERPANEGRQAERGSGKAAERSGKAAERGSGNAAERGSDTAAEKGSGDAARNESAQRDRANRTCVLTIAGKKTRVPCRVKRQLKRLNEQGGEGLGGLFALPED